jgi:hypothetical protein
MTERYISDRCEDIVERFENEADVTQGFGYHEPGELRCRVTDTGNGYIARFPGNSSTRQDYYVCLDYAQARDIVLALSAFKKELGFV